MSTYPPETFIKFGEPYYSEEAVPNDFTWYSNDGTLQRYVKDFLLYTPKGERLFRLEIELKSLGLYGISNDYSRLENAILYAKAHNIAQVFTYNDILSANHPCLARCVPPQTKTFKRVKVPKPHRTCSVRAIIDEWFIDYSSDDDGGPYLWVISKNDIFYRLESPAGRYASTFSAFSLKTRVIQQFMSVYLSTDTPLVKVAQDYLESNSENSISDDVTNLELANQVLVFLLSEIKYFQLMPKHRAIMGKDMTTLINYIPGSELIQKNIARLSSVPDAPPPKQSKRRVRPKPSPQIRMGVYEPIQRRTFPPEYQMENMLLPLDFDYEAYSTHSEYEEVRYSVSHLPIMDEIYLKVENRLYFRRDIPLRFLIPYPEPDLLDFWQFLKTFREFLRLSRLPTLPALEASLVESFSDGWEGILLDSGSFCPNIKDYIISQAGEHILEIRKSLDLFSIPHPFLPSIIGKLVSIFITATKSDLEYKESYISKQDAEMCEEILSCVDGSDKKWLRRFRRVLKLLSIIPQDEIEIVMDRPTMQESIPISQLYPDLPDLHDLLQLVDQDLLLDHEDFLERDPKELDKHPLLECIWPLLLRRHRFFLSHKLKRIYNFTDGEIVQGEYRDIWDPIEPGSTGANGATGTTGTNGTNGANGNNGTNESNSNHCIVWSKLDLHDRLKLLLELASKGALIWGAICTNLGSSNTTSEKGTNVEKKTEDVKKVSNEEKKSDEVKSDTIKDDDVTKDDSLKGDQIVPSVSSESPTKNNNGTVKRELKGRVKKEGSITTATTNVASDTTSTSPKKDGISSKAPPTKLQKSSHSGSKGGKSGKKDRHLVPLEESQIRADLLGEDRFFNRYFYFGRTAGCNRVFVQFLPREGLPEKWTDRPVPTYPNANNNEEKKDEVPKDEEKSPQSTSNVDTSGTEVSNIVPSEGGLVEPFSKGESSPNNSTIGTQRVRRKVVRMDAEFVSNRKRPRSDSHLDLSAYDSSKLTSKPHRRPRLLESMKFFCRLPTHFDTCAEYIEFLRDLAPRIRYGYICGELGVKRFVSKLCGRSSREKSLADRLDRVAPFLDRPPEVIHVWPSLLAAQTWCLTTHLLAFEKEIISKLGRVDSCKSLATDILVGTISGLGGNSIDNNNNNVNTNSTNGIDDNNNNNVNNSGVNGVVTNGVNDVKAANSEGLGEASSNNNNNNTVSTLCTLLRRLHSSLMLLNDAYTGVGVLHTGWDGRRWERELSLISQVMPPLTLETIAILALLWRRVERNLGDIYWLRHTHPISPFGRTEPLDDPSILIPSSTVFLFSTPLLQNGLINGVLTKPLEYATVLRTWKVKEVDGSIYYVLLLRVTEVNVSEFVNKIFPDSEEELAFTTVYEGVGEVLGKYDRTRSKNEGGETQEIPEVSMDDPVQEDVLVKVYPGADQCVISEEKLKTALSCGWRRSMKFKFNDPSNKESDKLTGFVAKIDYSSDPWLNVQVEWDRPKPGHPVLGRERLNVWQMSPVKNHKNNL